MKKRAAALILAFALAGTGLMGCGGGAPTATDNEAGSGAASTEKPDAGTNSAATDKQVEISFWAFPTMQAKGYEMGAYEAEIVKVFNDSHPNIKVNLEMIDFQNGPEKITASIEGGTAPDVIFDAPGRIIEWGKSGNLASLDDLFTDEFVKDVNNDPLLSSCTDGEHYYMYPLSSAAFTMAFNKTVLEKEGLMDMIPTEGDRTWTTDEFIALSKALAEKGYKGAEIYCGGQGGDQGTRAFLANLYGASITKPDLSVYTMDTPEAIKGMQLVVDGIEEGWMTPNTAGVANDALDHFDQGQVVSTVLWGPGIQTQRTAHLENSGIEVQSVCLPSESGTPVLEYLVNGFCVFDNGDADKIAASKEFIQFLCDDPEYGPKNVVASGCFPVRSSFGNLYPGDTEMEYYAGLTKYYGNYYNTINGFASMRPLWWGSLQAVLTGEKTAEEAMVGFTKDANVTINE